MKRWFAGQILQSNIGDVRNGNQYKKTLDFYNISTLLLTVNGKSLPLIIRWIKKRFSLKNK